MEEKDWSAYIETGVFYRLFTLVLSTAAYIAVSAYYKNTRLYWGIVLGMTLSCLLSIWLYRRIGRRRLWLRLMFGIEVFACGIFAFLSGGFSSPYLWYLLSCILFMAVLEQYLTVTLLASLWCLLCAAAGTLASGEGPSYQELNVGLGMLVTVGGFYILRSYIHYIEKQKKVLLDLNRNLEAEKGKSESILLQLADLYETFNLFAMTNPEKTLRELSVLLKRSVAPSGCLLVKLDGEGAAERTENCGIDTALTEPVLEEIRGKRSPQDDGGTFCHGGLKSGGGEDAFRLETGGGLYEAMFIGNAVCAAGVLVRRHSDAGQENESFYWKLTELIFSNLDTHCQMEKFITMEEQNRIAGEIHDTVIQKLFGVVCSLRVLERSVENMEEETLKIHLDSLKKSVELAMTELRESIYGREFTETVNTFSGAMALYMEEAQNLSGASIRMNIDCDSDHMTTAQKIAVYRISCEAVNNAIRHGKAENVKIDLKMTPESIELRIEDDGGGMAEKEEVFYEGNGLKNMRRIAALLKGSLMMEQGTEKGMKIRLELPR